MNFRLSSKPAPSLSFEEYIRQLPNDLVFQKLIKDSSLSRKILSASMLADIAGTFSREKDIQRRFDNLSPRARYDCACAYLFKNQGLPAPENLDFNDELLASFLVYASQGASSTRYYYGFDSFAEPLSGRIASVLIEHHGTDHIPAQSTATALLPVHCLNDFIVVCIFATRGLLKKTKNGALIKTSQSSLHKLLNSPYISSSGNYDKTIRLFLEYGLEKGILSFYNNAYVCNQPPLMQWLQSQLTTLHNDFAEYCFTQSASYPVIDRICHAAGKPWIRSGEISSTAGVSAHDVLLPLYRCGFVQAAKHENECYFSRSELFDAGSGGEHTAAPDDAVVILPDFSAIIPGEIQPRRLYDFSRIGTLLALDRVYKGKLDKKVINDSLSEGTDERRIIACLTKWNAPPNVVETIKEWIREFSRLFITSGSIVALRDKKTGNQLSSLESISDSLEPLDAIKVFRIKDGHENYVYSKLTELGFDPRIPSVTVPPARSMNPYAEDTHPRRKPITRFAEQKEDPSLDVKVGKYGSGLKK
ncbi:MAG: hypothetical protein GF350_02130, partial [Chitinivibrionales bacterium]|nr:hypothetical protein [Chitinivibrionales bacterium]